MAMATECPPLLRREDHEQAEAGREPHRVNDVRCRGDIDRACSNRFVSSRCLAPMQVAVHLFVIEPDIRRPETTMVVVA